MNSSLYIYIKLSKVYIWMCHLDFYNTCTCNYACKILHRVIILFKNEYEGYHMYIPDLILFLYSKSCNTPCRQLHWNVEYNTCTNKGTIAWYSSALPISVKLAVIGFPVYLAVWLMNVPLKGVLIGRFFYRFFFSNSKEQEK